MGKLRDRAIDDFRAIENNYLDYCNAWNEASSPDSEMKAQFVSDLTYDVLKLFAKSDQELALGKTARDAVKKLLEFNEIRSAKGFLGKIRYDIANYSKAHSIKKEILQTSIAHGVAAIEIAELKDFVIESQKGPLLFSEDPVVDIREPEGYWQLAKEIWHDHQTTNPEDREKVIEEAILCKWDNRVEKLDEISNDKALQMQQMVLKNPFDLLDDFYRVVCENAIETKALPEGSLQTMVEYCEVRDDFLELDKKVYASILPGEQAGVLNENTKELEGMRNNARDELEKIVLENIHPLLYHYRGFVEANKGWYNIRSKRLKEIIKGCNIGQMKKQRKYVATKDGGIPLAPPRRA